MWQTKFIRNILSGIENLLLHKLRSFLTMLGVVFGVGSVVAMLSVGEGASKEALEQIKKLGSTNIIISSVKSVEDESATAVLQIPRNQVRKEVLTIGDNARVREYRLRHTVEFSLLDGDGGILVPEQQLEQSRVLSFDEQDILGVAQEDEQLRREMADTLARLVVRRLGSARA